MITVEGGSVREGYGTTPPKQKTLGAALSGVEAWGTREVLSRVTRPTA
jgi:hypothetical protein